MVNITLGTQLGKRDNWFRDYQEMPGGRKGRRSLESRQPGFLCDDFDGKTVLDLGSNLGQMCLYAAKCGATHVLGIEYDKAAFCEAITIRNQEHATAVQYNRDDLDNPLCWHQIDAYDTVLLLSVVDTKELTNRFGIISRACMKCKKTLYLEGHQDQPHWKYFRYILDNTDFTQVECMGRYEGRILYRCTRDILDVDGFRRTLDSICTRYRRIAILGNRNAGKTFLCGRIIQPEFAVLDDCNDLEKIRSYDRLILADYRAAIYESNWEVVFNVLQPQDQYEVLRKRALVSSEIALSETLCCLYTVRTR